MTTDTTKMISSPHLSVTATTQWQSMIPSLHHTLQLTPLMISSQSLPAMQVILPLTTSTTKWSHHHISVTTPTQVTTYDTITYYQLSATTTNHRISDTANTQVTELYLWPSQKYVMEHFYPHTLSSFHAPHHSKTLAAFTNTSYVGYNKLARYSTTL